MKFVNRGYITVKPTNKFVEWANEYDEDFSDLKDSEASIYLIEEDFYDDEAVLKSYFKKIFLNELQAVSENEEDYPPITMEAFNDWFETELGCSVFDTQSSDLKAD